jgi:hypothetical protein
MNQFRRILRILVRRSPLHFITAIALCVLLGATVWAIASSSIPGEQVIRWTGFSLTTAVLFWYAIADRSASLRRRPMWLVGTLLVLAHCVTWAIVLTHVERWTLVWFGPLISMEMLAVFYFVDRLSRKPRPETQRTPDPF